jgi:gliding motility-associated-like protein
MKNFIKLNLLLLVATISSFSNAQQITTTVPNITPVDAVQNILLGAGVQAFNITYNTSAANASVAQNNVQEFNAVGTPFPIDEGVLMTTNGTGNLNDPDLDMITGGTATNGAIIEFDFIPTGDTLSFNYIFASTEYTGFTCSSFNDVFGFFISGPGITGPFTNNAVNIATVPGTNVPVAINTVNSGTSSSGNTTPCDNADPNWQSNSIYFTTSYNTVFGASNTPINGFNGGTVVLPANASLSCNDTFHIKLAIANDFDTGLDSGVFLEANSFSSNVVDINIESSASSLDTLLIEGCTDGNIYFTRPTNQSNDSLTIYFSTSGTADQGDDYPILSPGDSVNFLPGEDTIVLNISPIQDGSNEGFESVIISAYTVTECGDTVYSEGTIWIGDEPFSNVTALDTTILCANDSVPIWVNTVGGFGPYTYEWDTGDVGDTVGLAGLNDGETAYIVTSIDACGFEYQDTAIITLDQTLAIDTMLQFPTECGEATGAVSGQGSGFTGTPNYQWSGPGMPSNDSIGASVWQNLSSGWYYFSIEDDVCLVQDSIFLEQDPPPTADFTANPPVGNAPLNVTFVNNSDPADTYEWDFGNGQGNIVNNLDDQYTTYGTEGVYTVTLIVTEGACSDQATQNIIVTLILPLSYDMPNVFTPNNDNSNDEFTLNTVNATDLDLVILNRWGNVVYESSGDVNAAWNGQIQNVGQECNDGTYFYSFTIYGEQDERIEEHGFVQLVRDK